VRRRPRTLVMAGDDISAVVPVSDESESGFPYPALRRIGMDAPERVMRTWFSPVAAGTEHEPRRSHD